MSFSQNDAPVVIGGGKMAVSENGGGAKDELGAYFAVYRKLIVG
jgi:hypothetical protein